MMKRNMILIAVGLLFASTQVFGVTTHIMNIGDFFFSPTGTVVVPGDTVRWVLQSGVHTTTSDATSMKSWDSGPMSTPGETYDVVFRYADGPGMFPYHCTFHPTTMKDTIFTSQNCLASGDFDEDGMFSVSDLVILINIINGFFPPGTMDNLYEADLNGDCVLDGGDAELFNCYFVNGLSCFPVYPVPTCCYPDTLVGACCVLGDSCSIRSEDNCTAMGGTYLGNGTRCNEVEEYCCCKGIRGNVNYDPLDEINVADLSYLVDYLFKGDFLLCWEEGNVDGELGPGGIGTDVSDLTFLVDYLFKGGPPPPSCVE